MTSPPSPAGSPVERGVAVVTGASSGIGAATAVRLAAAGFRVVLGARREDRLAAVTASIVGAGGVAHALPLDVCDTGSVEEFAAAVADFGGARVLVNNAGGALGLGPVASADDEQWRWMYDANVLGTMRCVRSFLPQLVAPKERKDERTEEGTEESVRPGHIVNIGSVAGIEVYDGGAGYTTVKHALVALTKTLRLELLGQPVRITEIDPGLVETEFSVVRFGGDKTRADSVYAGLDPLTADDVADAVMWAVTRPSHVNIDSILMKPLAQASAQRIARTA